MSWIGPGMGPDAGSPGNAQAASVFNVAGGQVIAGTGTGGAIANADISTITTAMAADVLAQLEAQPLFGQMGAWTTGGN